MNGIEQGLVELRTLLYPGTGEPQDRAQAAREMLSFLAAHGSEKPWLLVYDNIDDARVLKAWPPPNNVQMLMTSRLGNWRGDIASIDVAVWTLAQPVDHRQQHGHVGGVSRQHLGAERPAPRRRGPRPAPSV